MEDLNPQNPINPSSQPLPHPLSTSTTEPIILLNHPISTKLTRTNFLAWQPQILPILHGYGLNRFIEPSPPPPELLTDSTGRTSPNPAFLPWTKQDQIVLGWLRSSLSETLLGQMFSCKTSARLWSSLQSNFSASSRAHLSELRCKLLNTTKAGSSCSDYVQTMRSIADELAFIGFLVSDDDLAMHILGGLGPDFNPFVLSVTTARRDPWSIEELQRSLFTYENLLQCQSQVNSSSLPSSTNPAAFVSYSGNTRYPPRPGQRPSYPPRNYTPRPNGPLLPTPINRPSYPQSRPGNFRPKNRPDSGPPEFYQICYKMGHSARAY